MDDLHQVDAWLAALLANLEPAARTKMLREVARDVRRIQQQNMTAQRAPDGTAWEPRKVTTRTKPGRVRRKMFMKLKTAKYLKIKADENAINVEFNSSAQRIAKLHHYGLKEKIKGRELKNRKRALLGMNDKSIRIVENRLLFLLGYNRKIN